jgi:hypothetical protein
MTSDLGVERGVDHPFRFHCSCGAIIETSAKKEICHDCGETIEVIQCVPRPHGDKCTLRITKHRHRSHTQPIIWPPVTTSTRRRARPPRALLDPNEPFRNRTTMQRTRYYLEPDDYNERCLRKGVLILLSPLWVPLIVAFLALVFSPPRVPLSQPADRTIETPEPTDCGLFSGCHYEKRLLSVKDNEGGHIVVMWQRVND